MISLRNVAAVSSRNTWRDSLRLGLTLGGVTLFITLVGLVGAFRERGVIFEVITMGQTLLLLMAVIGGFLTGARTREQPIGTSVLHGGVAGLTAGAVMGMYLILATVVDLRTILVNSSKDLLEMLSFGLPFVWGALVCVLSFALLGGLASLLSRTTPRLRTPLITSLATVLCVGILRDLLNPLLSGGLLKPVARFLFAPSGLSFVGAITIFALTAGLSILQPYIKQRVAPARNWLNQPGRAPIKYGGLALILGPLLFALPWILQLYLSDVTDMVGLYVLMGLGLNIVVGYAGLLDLGYVAFYAIGAYTMAVLTSPASVLGIELSFWAALPICMLAAGFAGILLGIPVLRMRGDYLAIVTLGFGEIIGILALSEALKSYTGGSLGILKIPKPILFGLTLKDSQYLYYIVLIGCLIALYVSWRLSDSRIGRAWIAMREDEDVAEAMGINLIEHKLMAFAIGATFAGMAGGIFASKLSSVYPNSFDLLVSINVLCLIIVGGMASLPGVFVGALVLVGLPELLREFSEFRSLMYGAALVAMMLLRPEGFWPAARRQRELHSEEALGATD